MKNILTPANRELLVQFSWSNVLVAFDYDGTLAPIVGDPSEAMMRARTRDLLEALTKRYPTIVVSGRSQLDVRDKLRGVHVAQVIGNHGIEPWHANDRHVAEVQRWKTELAECVSQFRGVILEDKTFSVAIHYRHSRQKRLARAAVLRKAARLGNVRVIGGKQVINLLPLGAPHKGVAIERERERLRCDTAIYVGDDETDEDVFTLDQPGRLLTIRVGQKRTSAAHYFIENQRSIDRLLRVLLDLRNDTHSVSRSVAR